MVANAGKVANTAAADEHNAVLLQVVAFARDVGDDFALVGQANLGHLAQSGVRLLRRRRVDAGADTALLRVLLHRRDLGLGLLRFAALADQLVDCRHMSSFSSPVFSEWAKMPIQADPPGGDAKQANGQSGSHFP